MRKYDCIATLAGGERRVIWPPLLGLAFAVEACGPAGYGDYQGTVGQSRESILQGTLSSDAIDLGLRAPWTQTGVPFSCSATLVRNDLIITAGHCFQQDTSGQESCRTSGTGCPVPDVAPENMPVTQHATSNSANDVNIFGAIGGYVQSPVLDVAVMKLATPFTVNGSTLGHSVPLWGGFETDLDQHSANGYEHQQRGYGYNNCTANDTQRDQVTHPDPGSTGTYIHYLREGTGVNERIHDHGDSGSAYRWKHARYLTLIDEPILAITTYVDQNAISPPTFPDCPDHAYSTKVTEFRPWAHSQIEAVTPSFEDSYISDPLSWYSVWQGPSSWSVTGGSLVQTEDGPTYAIDNRLAGSNSEIESTIYSTDTDGDVALLGRVRDICNLYMLLISKQNSRVKIIRRVACAEQILKDVSYSVDLNNGGAGRLVKFRLFGSALSAYIANTLVASGLDVFNSDGWLTAGKFGFYNKNMGSPDVRFRNIKVTPQAALEL